MGVSAEPASCVHVYPALDAKIQPLLPRLDSHFRPQRLVLESARHIHDHIAPWQPAFAPTVNVGVGDLTHAHIATHVYVPSVEVGIDLIVMSVRLIRNPFRRSEVDPARHRPAGVVVYNRHLHPVAPAVHQLDACPWSLSQSILLDLSPRKEGDGLTILLD